MPTLLLVAGGLAFGYLTGRTRPARWIGHTAWDWADDLSYRRPPVARRTWRWWTREAIYAAAFLGFAVTHPRRALESWRTRNDPPPRSPAIRLAGDWPPEDPR